MKTTVIALANQMARHHNIDEAMKARDQLAWVGAMNAIRNQAEEIALKEIVYTKEAKQQKHQRRVKALRFYYRKGYSSPSTMAKRSSPTSGRGTVIRIPPCITGGWMRFQWTQG